MHQVMRELHFSYGHRLLNHPGKCASLHGHNARVCIEVSASRLDEMNMVLDFSRISEEIGCWIDENLDHKMILWDEDPAVSVLQRAGEKIVTMKENPTAEALSRWIFLEARKKGVPVSKVTFWETADSAAVYYE